ncbi:MAG: glycosyltransferase family 9 protein [Candidatus Aureabacteria bacterium]|nr:glycosyltransferase family 9 protein [Candidatus Auribacterota bacterium]
MFSPAEVFSLKKKLRVVVTGGLGDNLLATPYFRYFRLQGRYKQICAVFPRQAMEIFDRNPFIDEHIPCGKKDIFLWALPEKDVDVFSPYVDVRRKTPSNFTSRVELSVSRSFNDNSDKQYFYTILSRHHGFPVQDMKPEIFTDPSDEAWADDYLKPWKGQPLLFFHPFSPLREKNLPVSLSRKLISRLKKYFVIFHLPRPDYPLPGVQALKFPVSPRKSAALFKHMSCVVSVNSFPAHLAHAVQIPAVVLFGPTNPLVYAHPGQIAVQSPVCKPCAGTPKIRRCRSFSCMKTLSVEMIAESVCKAASKGMRA